MNNKYFFIAVPIILFSMLISCKKTVVREKEPNNDYSTATKIEPNTLIEGLLDTPADQDFYRIDITSPAVMDIELTPVKGVNHAIKIWKDKNREYAALKYIDDSRKSSPERMCNMFFDMGTYYIAVMHGERDNPQGNAENYYELRLSSRPWEGEEMEPNDTYESANLLGIGAEVRGYFSPSFNKLNQNAVPPFREEDWYYFDVDLTDNQPVLFDIVLSGVPDINSILYLLDSDRNEIALSDAGVAGDGERLESIGIKKTGRYYIVVTSHFESNNNTPYRLQALSRSYDFSSEIEPNDNFGTANLIVRNEITGRIAPEGDKDYFTFNSESLYGAGNDSNPVKDNQLLYRIEALPKNLDLALRVFDENKKNLFEIDNIKGPGKEVMPDAFLKNNFYIEVSAKRGENSNTEYKLNVSHFPYSENYEIEPNDTKETANRIKSSKITGFISKKDDRDYYLLEYKNRVRKKITLHGIKDSELKISITDPLGFIIKTESVNGTDSISFTEMIDSKGYLIVEPVMENYDDPYNIELGE